MQSHNNNNNNNNNNNISADTSSQLYRFLAENGVLNVGSIISGSTTTSSSVGGGGGYDPTSSCLMMERSVITEMTPHDKAAAALRNHKEAEKRRRERINSHLDKLRTLLPCNSKTDKASLLAKVVQRVKELKQQASHLPDVDTFPSEIDEVAVFSGEYSSDDGQMIFKASLCCEDRPELLQEIVEVLKSLHLKTLRAEMVTLGGRMRNVFIVAADKDQSIESVHFLQNALKSLLERSNNDTSERSKRRRVLDNQLVL